MIKIKIIIEGRLPSLNEYICAERSNKYKAAKMKKDAENRICHEIKKHKNKKYTNKVYIHYLWVEKDYRRDKDNIAFAKKFIQDSLVTMGVIRNDGWREIQGFTDDFSTDRKRPRVEIFIEEITQ